MDFNKKEMPIQGWTGFGGGATGASFRSSGAEKKYIDDYFSTYLYTGNASYPRTITNNIDFSGTGGLLIQKSRSDGYGWAVYDTVRGAGSTALRIDSNAGANANVVGPYVNVDQFNSDGFRLNSTSSTDVLNGNNLETASWSFLKKEGFLDIQTWTGNGSNRTIAHDLGVIPSMILVKKTSGAEDWTVYHRDVGNEDWLYLNTDDDTQSGGADPWNDTSPTASVFSVGSHNLVNENGQTYVAYLFADGSSKLATSRSVYFDGSSDYLLSTSSDYSPGTGDFTMEAWVNVESGVQATDGIYQLSDTSGAFKYGGIALLYKKSASENRWELYGGNITNNNETAARTGYEYGQWVHTAIVKTSGYIKLYINGEERISEADTQNYSGYQYLGLGSAFASTQNFKGKISNFKLTIGEALYTSDFTPTNEPLTTTSQGSTASNVEILCCNNSSVTGKTVGATITSNGTVTASRDNPNFIDPDSATFGESGDQVAIKCGVYKGESSHSTIKEVNVGFEPQWVLIKNAGLNGKAWVVLDSGRFWTTLESTNAEYLRPNTADAAADGTMARLTSTGFVCKDSSFVNGGGSEYNFIYLAIRKSDGHVGKPPSAGNEVFTPIAGSANAPMFKANNHLVDLTIQANSNYATTTTNRNLTSRLSDGYLLQPNTTAVQQANSYQKFDYPTGTSSYTGGSGIRFGWLWKRYAGVDVVAYKGDGVSERRIRHNLKNTPEMIWTKNRSSSGAWRCWHKDLNGGGANAAKYYLELNDTTSQTANGDIYGGQNGILPNSTDWAVGGNAGINENGSFHLAMAFASVSGISKVGSYTGSGSEQTITLGFQPRLLIVKKYTGSPATNWYIIDTVRGWGSGDDKYLELSSDAAQADHDFGAPTSTGMTLPGGEEAFNASGSSYIYYAHA